MNGLVNSTQFAEYLFDQDKSAVKGGYIIHAILKSRSPRLSDISQHMTGNPDANYKMIQRFFDRQNPKEILLRLFQEDAPFIIGDPTEIPRIQAKKTPYVGTLKDGKTKGFWLLMLATPYRGRAIPFHFVTYSSRTIAKDATSRNRKHFDALLRLKKLVGERPVVLDREFSYGLLLENLFAANIHFVIRLRMGSKPPNFFNAEGRHIKLRIAQNGKKVIYRQLLYQGKVSVNLVGIWKKGHRQPLWVMTDLEPERGLGIYNARCKIEQSFRDLKSLLNLDKIMNKLQINMEKVVAMMLIAYTIGVILGEVIRDHIYPCTKKSEKQRILYSGIFILLKRKTRLDKHKKIAIYRMALDSFKQLVWADVRIHV